ncbi:MAG: apolipoprotein N-acyltransferase [Spirochaetaceae bacterium]|nr:MAG: apolipoprotein N-acyltransferase [Spirochaetaceae bacterium]
MIRRDSLCAAASGILLAVALPNEFIPYGTPLIAPIALIPLFYALLHSRRRRDSVRIGVIFAVISTGLSNYWLANFGEFAIWTIGGPIIGYSLYNSLLFPVLQRILQGPARGERVFVAAAAWAGYEFLKSVGFLGYPWGLISYPAGVYLPLIQHVDVTGVWALSFLFAATNLLGAELLYHREGILCDRLNKRLLETPNYGKIPALSKELMLRSAGFSFLVFILMMAYGYRALTLTVPAQAELQLVMVQNNTDSWERGNEEPSLLVAQRLTRRGLRQLAPVTPDLIVWSETLLRRPYAIDREYYRHFPSNDPFVPFVAEAGVPLLTGGPHVELRGDEWLSYNSALLILPSGELEQNYGKRQLVPFAEHIPFWELSVVRNFFRDVVGIFGTWTPGPEITIFELPIQNRDEPLRFATPICFEDAFSGVARAMVREGAEVLINLTNNSWSQTNSAQTQHFVAAQFRAVEMRTTLIRSSNSGLSTIVDPHGRRVIELPMFEQDYYAGTVSIQQSPHPTIYTRWGDYLAWAFLFLVTLVLAVKEFQSRSSS